jgi:hypothetical protein
MTLDQQQGIALDWQRYLAQYDMIYEMQSRCWQDGTPLGNGSLAAVAFEPFHLEWSVNKNDVWDYRLPQVNFRYSVEEMRERAARGECFLDFIRAEDGPDVGRYPAPKTCGQLRLRFGLDSVFSPAHRISKRLKLHEGTLRTSLDKHLSHPRVTSFVCAQEDVLVVQVREVSAMVAFHNKVDLYRVSDASMPPVVRGAEGDRLWIDQTFHDGFRFVMMARIVPRGGSAYADLFRATVDAQWHNTIEPSQQIESHLEGEYAVAPVAGDIDIFLTVVTSREAEDPFAAAEARLADAVSRGSEALHAEHARWWAAFWTKCYVGFDEPLLEQLWYVSLYNLATTLRGTPVGGLIGLWYGPMDTPSQALPWSGGYVCDYNAQLPIMPVCKVNHPELADGTLRTVLGQLPAAMRHAREDYGLPGAVFPNGPDPDGNVACPAAYRMIHSSGPFWSVLLWWRYLYTKDADFLQTVAYPIMREVAAFFVNYLVWHPEEGLYHLEISQQAELMYIDKPDPNMTLALMKYTLQAVIEAAETLAVDAELAEQCRHILAHCPPYPGDGLELSPAKGLPVKHLSQFGNLWPLYPCGEFDPEVAPQWRDLCLRELAKNDYWQRTFGLNEGSAVWWSGMIFLNGLPAIRLEMRETAWTYLENLLKANVKPNGLISHNSVFLVDSRRSEENIANIPDDAIQHDRGGKLKAVEIQSGRLYELCTENLDCQDTISPVHEGPALYLLLISEMLLQSQNGILRLFPAWPCEKTAQFIDLRAEGPTLVSAQKVEDQVTFIHLQALDAVAWKLRNPWAVETLHLRSNRQGDATVCVEGKYLELTLRAGEEVTIAALPEHLVGKALIQPCMDQSAQARLMSFHDGMLVWLGKPEPAEYYTALQQARRGRYTDEMSM